MGAFAAMKTPDTYPDFAGKVVKVLLPGIGKSGEWWSFEEPEFETQGGRLFLVGKLTNPTPGGTFWAEKMTAAAAWDSVAFYTVEAVEDRMARKMEEAELSVQLE
jgi:hypothetical protein